MGKRLTNLHLVIRCKYINIKIMSGTNQYIQEFQDITRETIDEMLKAGLDTSKYLFRIFDILVKHALTLNSQCCIREDLPCTLDYWKASQCWSFINLCGTDLAGTVRNNGIFDLLDSDEASVRLECVGYRDKTSQSPVIPKTNALAASLRQGAALTCAELLQCEYAEESAEGKGRSPQSGALDQGKAFTSAESPPPHVSIFRRFQNKQPFQ